MIPFLKFCTGGFILSMCSTLLVLWGGYSCWLSWPPHYVSVYLLNWWIYLASSLAWLCLQTKAIGLELQRDEFIQHSSITRPNQDKERMLNGAGFPIEGSHWPPYKHCSPDGEKHNEGYSLNIIEKLHFSCFLLTKAFVKAAEPAWGYLESRVGLRDFFCAGSLISCYILNREEPQGMVRVQFARVLLAWIILSPKSKLA